MHPAKAVGRNEMQFSVDARLVPGNIVLDRGAWSPTGRGDLGFGTPVKICIVNCDQTATDNGNSGMITIDCM